MHNQDKAKVSPIKKRSERDERLVSYATAGVLVVIAAPVVAVIIGLSVRLFRVIAG